MVVRAGGRDSTTRFARIASYRSGPERRALLHVRPLTGRTHQIRVHLAFARLPIVGDPVYGRKSAERDGLDRQFLHAWRLSVNLPHAGPKTFTAPLAPDLALYLGSLGAPNDTAAPFQQLGMTRSAPPAPAFSSSCRRPPERGRTLPSRSCRPK